MSDQSDKTTAAIATAAAIALGAAILASTGAKPGQAVDVQAIVVECTDAGGCAKTQRLYRCVVGEGTDAGLDCGKLPPGVQLIPGTASKPYTSKDSAKQLAPGEAGQPCACAPWGVPGCEALTRTIKGDESWVPAPIATVLQAGSWRGASCIPAHCFETLARTALGSTIPAECRPPVKAEKPRKETKPEATEVKEM